jgi:hypothetical protein
MPFKDPERKRAYNRELARRLRAKDPAASVASVMRSRDPAKHRARATLAYAKRTGKIAPLPCEVCGDVVAQAHHDDYTKPLDVRWLCQQHHAQLHAKAKAA